MHPGSVQADAEEEELCDIFPATTNIKISCPVMHANRARVKRKEEPQSMNIQSLTICKYKRGRYTMDMPRNLHMNDMRNMINT